MMRKIGMLLTMLLAAVTLAAGELKPVKYVFLFIGDGMSIPQRMLIDDYQKMRRGVGTLPSGTKQKPFAFRVIAPSTFRLRINDPQPGDNQGKATWHYTVVTAANAEAFRESDEGKNCQWKFWAPGR